MSDQSRKVLVSPLNWGLGHAARCIPVIKTFLYSGKEVILASDGGAKKLLEEEFPELESYELPSYNIHYRHPSMLWNMVSQAPRIWNTIQRENKTTARIVKDQGIDTIVSDNRFGVRHPDVYNIIVSHQINIQHRYVTTAAAATKINKYWIRQFDECWIPDVPPPESLAGSMSNPKGIIKHSYIGMLSRMKKEEVPVERKYLAILSGPEPARTRLEKLLLRKLSGKDYLLVRGVVSNEVPAKKQILNYLASQSLNREICRSEMIICRSGYSSIMDLKVLKKKGILIPTPGQPEQEYLAKRLQEQRDPLFTILNEEEIKGYSF